MIDPSDVPAVSDNELLARFVLYSNETRADGTVKPKLFLPYSRVDLSVNRHREATDDETWQTGRDVATERQRTLYGLANIRASNCRFEPLDVIAKPLPGNLNHADIVGYPAQKEDQMAIATLFPHISVCISANLNFRAVRRFSVADGQFTPGLQLKSVAILEKRVAARHKHGVDLR